MQKVEIKFYKMKNSIQVLAIGLLITFLVAFKPYHDSHITITSPKLNATYTKGQQVDIKFKVVYETEIKTVSYTITDQTGKSLLAKEINGDKRKVIEEKTAWPVNITVPTVLKLIIKSTDNTGHSNTKKVQFSVNL